MKTTHTTTDERSRRDREFVEMFTDVLHEFIRNGIKAPFTGAVRFTLLNGKPHYHVSYERAYRIVCRILAGRTLQLVNPVLIAMWHEIAGKVREIIGDGQCSINRALEIVLLNCRASRFFLTEKYARRLVYHLRTRRANAIKSRCGKK